MDVVCALLERKGHFLVCKRPLDKDSGGLWEFPGGKVEPGETNEEAIMREVYEELGITVIARASLEPVKTRWITLIPIYVTEIAGLLSLKEHTDLRWLQPHDLVSLSMCEGDTQVVRTLISMAADP